MDELIAAAKQILEAYDHACHYKYDEVRWDQFEGKSDISRLRNALAEHGVRILPPVITEWRN